MRQEAADKLYSIPKDYFKWEKRILYFLGVSLYKQEESALYKIYSFTVLSVVMGYMMIHVFDIANIWNRDLEAFLNIFTYMFLHITSNIEILISIYNRHKLIIILNVVQRGNFATSKHRGGTNEILLVHNHLQYFNFQRTALIFLLVLVMLPQFIYCFVSRFSMSPKHWTLPVTQTTLPIFKTKPYFDIILVYQTVMAIFTLPMAAMEYFLMVKIISQVSLQLKMLQNAFLHIQERVDSNLDETFKELVKYHIDIQILLNQVQDLCSTRSLVLFFTGSTALCFNLYLMSMLPVFSTLFLQAVCIYSALSFKLFMWYYWNNEITLENANISNAICQINWVGTSLDFQKGLLQVMTKCQLQVVMRAGDVHDFVLENFVTIIKFSYSGFTIIRSIKQ